MILERTTNEIENGINQIIKEIEFLKSLDNDLVDLDSIGSVQGHLDCLTKIRFLEDILDKFHINNSEIVGNEIKILP